MRDDGDYWSWGEQEMLQLDHSLKLVTHCGHIGVSICAKTFMVLSVTYTIHEGRN